MNQGFKQREVIFFHRTRKAATETLSVLQSILDAHVRGVTDRRELLRLITRTDLLAVIVEDTVTRPVDAVSDIRKETDGKMPVFVLCTDRGTVEEQNALEAGARACLHIDESGEKLAKDFDRFLWSTETDKQLLRTITDNPLVAITAMDTDGRVTFFSRGAERITGYSSSDVLGHPIEDVFSDPQDARKITKRVLEQGAVENVSTTVRSADGRQIPLEMYIVATYDTRNRPTGSLAVSVDVTKRRSVEEEAARRSGELAAANAITSILSRSVSLRERFEAALVEITSASDVDGACVHLLDDDDILRLEASCGIGEVLAKRYEVVARGDGLEWQVLECGEHRVAADVESDGNVLSYVAAEGYHSTAVFPLRGASGVLGTITLLRIEPWNPDFRVLHLLSSLTAQLAGAAVTERLLALERARVARLFAINALGRQIVATHDRDALLDEVVRVVADLSGAHYVGVALPMHDINRLIYPAEEVRGTRYRPGQHSQGTDEGLVGRCFNEGVSVIVNRADDDPAYLAVVTETKAELCLPLRVGEDVIGVLDLQSDREGAFDDESVATFETVADQVALALRNQSLFEATRRRSEELTTLNAIVEAAGRDPHLETTMRVTLERTIDLVGADAGWMVLASEDGELSTEASVPDEPIAIRDLNVSDIPLVKSVYSSESSTRTEVHCPIPEVPLYETLGVGNLFAVPLSSKGWTLGAMVLYRRGPWRFDDSEVSLLESATSQVGVAIENAQLYHRALTRAREVSLLLEISQALNSDLSPDHVVQRVVRSAATLVQAPGAAFGRIEGDAIIFTERLRDDEWVSMNVSIRVGEGAVGEAVERRRPSVVGEPGQRQLTADESNPRGGVNRMVIVPISDERGESLGVIEVHDPETPGGLGAENIALLVGLANQAAVALRNADLYDQARHRLEVLARLYEASRAVVATTSPDDLIDTILKTALGAIGADSGVYFRLDVQTDCLLLQRGIGLSDELIRRITVEFTPTIGQQQGIVGAVAAERRPVLLRDVTTDPRWRRFDKDEKSALYTPVVAEDELFGVLVFTSSKKHAFGSDDADLLAAFANQAAAALRNAIAVERIRHGASREHLLNEINRAVRQTGDYVEAASAVVHSVGRELGSLRCVLYESPLGSEGTDSFVVSHEYRRDDVPTILGEKLPIADTSYLDRVATDGEASYVQDAASDHQFTSRLDILEKLKIGSLATVPVVYRERVVAVIEVHAESPRIWSAREKTLLEAVAGELAIAIENARLFRELEERVSDLEALYSVGVELSQSLSAPDVEARTLEFVRRIVDADKSVVFRFDESNGLLVSITEKPDPNARPLLPWTLPVEDEGTVATAFRESRTVLVNDTHSWLDQRTTGSELAVPLIARGRVVGVLYVGSESVGAFEPRDVQVLTTFGSLVAVSLENASLFSEIEGRVRDLEAVHRMGLEMTVALDVETVLDHVLDVVEELLEPFSAVLFDLNEQRRTLEAKGVRGEVLSPDAPGMSYDMDGDGVVPWVAREGRPFLSQDLENEPLYVRKHADVKSIVAVPLRARGRILGVLKVDSSRVGVFDDKSVRMLTILASQAAVALENATLFAEIEARAARLSGLHELARALAVSLDINQLGREVADRLPGLLLSAITAEIHLFDSENNDFEIIAVSGTRSVGATGERVALRSTPSGTVLRTRRSFVVADVSHSGRSDLRPYIDAGLQSLAAIPVIADEAVLGILLVGSNEVDAFPVEDVHVLTAVAANFAVAVKNARLYSDLQQTVRELRDTEEQVVMLEKLRALGELSSGVAHDFNNLLSGILGTAQLAQSDTESESVRARLKVIEQAALDGAETVRRIQEFSRKRVDRELEPVDLDECVVHAVEVTSASWRNMMIRRGVQIEVFRNLGSPPEVSGNPSEIREVIANIILNAVDAMPEGGTIEIRTSDREDRAVLEIEDTGTGMTEEVMRRIFDPFFTTKGVKGVGLGLSVVYGIVNRHGGTIEVDSVPGKGTTFCVSFRLAGEGKPVVQAVPPPAPVEKARIAIIDDEEMVRTVVHDVLSREGHTVVPFADPRDFLIAFDAGDRYDLVITNLGMPEVSGWEIARRVADDAPLTVVGLITGWTVDHGSSELAEKGVNFVVSKPFTADALVEGVNRGLLLRNERISKATQ
jgi:PAS domain S-box-containing protein